jgi:serine/threonine-protein kinase Chk2
MASQKRMFGKLTRMLQGSPEREVDSFKKPRRSERLVQKPDEQANDPQKTPISNKHNLPSPVTNITTDESRGDFKEATATPPGGGHSQIEHRNGDAGFSQINPFSSPPGDTQAFSQYVESQAALSDEVQDEVKEGVFGYLFPLDTRYGGRCLVMRERACCPQPETVAKAIPGTVSKKRGQKALVEQEKDFEKSQNGLASGGYLIGRHPECGESLRFPPLMMINSDLLQISSSTTQ